MNRIFFAPAILFALVQLNGASDPLADWSRMKDIVPRSYVCTRATNALQIDGRLDDPAWAAAPWTQDFVDIEGAAKPAPRFRTRARMLWDDTFLYIGVGRLSFSRVEWNIDISSGSYRKVPGQPEYNWVWSPQGIVDMHRPERWGYVQFTSQPAATVKITPDPARAGRDFLQGVYYAQRRFRAANNRWAGSFEELGWSAEPAASAGLKPSLTMTPEGYRAVVETPDGMGGRQRWSIDQHSRIRP